MKTTFKKGDVVTLQSGGPEMTIDSILPDIRKVATTKQRVVCKWFENNELKSTDFNSESLVFIRHGIE